MKEMGEVREAGEGEEEEEGGGGECARCKEKGPGAGNVAWRTPINVYNFVNCFVFLKSCFFL